MSTGFTMKQWRQIKDRDQVCVWHGEGCDPDMLVPQHRSGRGMGGSRSKNRLSNGVALCSLMNGLIESDAALAAEARARGIKLSIHDDPAVFPVVYPDGEPWWLDDEGGRSGQPSGCSRMPSLSSSGVRR